MLLLSVHSLLLPAKSETGVKAALRSHLNPDTVATDSRVAC
jgi:hypothetical protein